MKTYDSLISELHEAVRQAKTKTKTKKATKRTTSGGRAKGKIRGFGKKFAEVLKRVEKLATYSDFPFDSNPADDIIENPWHLTGHEGEFHTNDKIERMKRKVFGSGTLGRSELFFWVEGHGMLSFPAVANAMHYQYLYDARKLGKIVAQGRIEHHDGGRGIISLSPPEAGFSLTPVIRSLRRKFPKYVIHDGYGQEFTKEEREV
jgi:hypothetical protein